MAVESMDQIKGRLKRAVKKVDVSKFVRLNLNNKQEVLKDYIDGASVRQVQELIGAYAKQGVKIIKNKGIKRIWKEGDQVWFKS